jgi:glycosyltransferase involved in cell wall biosynthesis
MRIAYVCTDPDVPVFGGKGSSIHVQEMLRTFSRRGAQIDLFATSLGGAIPAGLERMTLHQLPAAPKGDQATRERMAWRANSTIRQLLAASGGFDLIYERYALWSFSAQEYAQSASIPSILEVNAPLITEQATYRGLIDISAATRASLRAFQAAGAISAVSEAVANYVNAFPLVTRKTHVIPNGVDPARFPQGLAASWPAPQGVFTVGFVGPLKPWHGLPTLLSAMKRLVQHNHQIRLLLVGDGPERANLELQASATGLARHVQFTGSVAPEAIPAILASMDVAVAPYPDMEQFYCSPLKVFEYMAAGLPVIASRIGQIEQLIQPGKTGVLCAQVMQMR